MYISLLPCILSGGFIFSFHFDCHLTSKVCYHAFDISVFY